MAASGGTGYRNGATSRNSLKPDKPFSPNSHPKSSLKSKSLPNSALRRSSPASLGAAKDDGGGLLFAFLPLVLGFFFFFFFGGDPGFLFVVYGGFVILYMIHVG